MSRADTDETLPASQSDHIAPAVIEGYQVGAIIGRGGMGEVVLAHDQAIGRDVAIKRMRDPNAPPEEVERFMREARIQALLDHPAIVPVHEVGTDAAGRPYFTMKRVSGTTLAALLAGGGEKPQRLLRAFIDTCLAVELAHTRRIVHRDLKPANIMLGDFGDVYILDWGLARVLDEHHVHPTGDSLRTVAASGMTRAGTVLGTPGYMAPEQLRGEAAGTKADVYALGAILFEILAGESLHDEARANDTLPEQLSPMLRSPSRAIPPELDRLCLAALAETPRDRPSARELADTVQAYLDGDRDLAQRRELAHRELEQARGARQSGDRGAAIHHAGRALTLDPESVDASNLVTELVVEVPPTLPQELRDALEDGEREFLKLRSRPSVFAYLAVIGLVPFLPFMTVVSWPILVAMFAMTGVMALLQWLNSRTGRVPMVPIFIGNYLLVMLFSRVAGSLLLTPVLICAIAIAIAARSGLRHAPLVAAAWGIVAMLTVVVLEQLGVFGATFILVPDTGILVSATAVSPGSNFDLVLLITGTIGLIVIVGLFSGTIIRSRNDALRRMHIQAWQLQQLLPSRALVR